MRDREWFLWLWRREWRLHCRHWIDGAYPLAFVMLVSLLFPLATTSDARLLSELGAGVIWVAILLATLLTLPKLFELDHQDGSIEQCRLSSMPMTLYVIVRVFVHWIFMLLPSIVITPLLAVMYHLSLHSYEILLFSLLLGTPILNCLGAVIATITVGLARSGWLLSVTLIPLYIPPLILATSAVTANQMHLSALPQLLWLAVFMIVAMCLFPWVSAQLLRYRE